MKEINSLRYVLYALLQVSPKDIDPGVPGSEGLVNLAQSYVAWASWFAEGGDLAAALDKLAVAEGILCHLLKSYWTICPHHSYQSERLDHVIETLVSIRLGYQTQPEEYVEEFSDQDYVELQEELD